MQIIHKMFKENFFNKERITVCREIQEEYSAYIGIEYDVSHIEALHDLGYLPIIVKALPEGSSVPMKVPVLTIYNTLPEFYWITNFLETIISNLLWKPITSATIARQYRTLLTKHQMATDKDNGWIVDFQAHDFSMRGMDSIQATMSSGLGHATSFLGSDSLPVIHAARDYYGEEGAVVHSVNATEHSVMCAGGDDDELGTFRYLMKQFPTGILSIVSDTWDLWKVLTEYLPELKDEIMARDGKIVIRPDSGDPVDIICGKNSRPRFVDYDGKWLKQFSDSKYLHEKELASESEVKGVVELLWDLFGGTINEQGYKVLDPHIGAIYGDSITLERADEICKRLAAKGFASTNIVLGIGSFTYQYNTRDTFGFAMKATYVELLESKNGNASMVEGREIFKDPITDDGIKKSAKGLLMVQKNDFNGDYELVDQVSWKEERQGELKTIYVDGVVENKTTLSEVRARLKEQ